MTDILIKREKDGKVTRFTTEDGAVVFTLEKIGSGFIKAPNYAIRHGCTPLTDPALATLKYEKWETVSVIETPNNPPFQLTHGYEGRVFAMNSKEYRLKSPGLSTNLHLYSVLVDNSNPILTFQSSRFSTYSNKDILLHPGNIKDSSDALLVDGKGTELFAYAILAEKAFHKKQTDNAAVATA